MSRFLQFKDLFVQSLASKPQWGKEKDVKMCRRTASCFGSQRAYPNATVSCILWISTSSHWIGLLPPTPQWRDDNTLYQALKDIFVKYENNNNNDNNTPETY